MKFLKLLLAFSFCFCTYYAELSDKCITLYHEKGGYICYFNSDSDVTDALTCEVVGATSCDGTKTQYISPAAGDPGKLYFKLVVTASKYEKTIHVTIKKTVSGATTYAESYTLEYFLKLEAQPNIKCTQTESTNYYETKFSCEAILTDSNFRLSQTGRSDCSAQIPDVVASVHQEIMKKKTYNVAILDSEKKCNRECTITLNTPDTDRAGNQLSMTIKHKTACPSPEISCDSHDTALRMIQCKIRIPYSFTKIDLEVNGGKVTTDPISIASASLNSEQATEVKIKYKIPDVTTTSTDFEIKFKVTQTGAAVVHEITERFKFVLKNEEIPGIKCTPLEKTGARDIGELHYSCDVRSSSTGSTLEIVDNPAFTLTNQNPTLKIINGLHVAKGHLITIKPIKVKCNDHQKVTIKITGTSDQEEISHTTICPEPKIDCDKHDMEERKVTCKIKAEYDVDEIKIVSKTSHVSINVNPILKTSLSTIKTTPLTQEIVYTVKTNAKPTVLQIEFEILQENAHSVLKIIREFGYSLKASELPFLTCSEKSRTATLDLNSNEYTCNIRSSTTGVVLQTEEIGYSIESPNVETNVEQTSNMHTKSGHVVKINYNKVVCHKERQIKIFFGERSEKSECTLRHVINCPEPIVNYKSHDAKLQQITVNVKIEYEFAEIKLRSSKSYVEITPNKIEYGEFEDNKDFEQTISYKISDLQKAQHSFEIIMEFIQEGNHKVYESRETFTYSIKSEEIPNIHCDILESDHSPKYESMRYNCKIVSNVQDIHLSTNKDNEFEISPKDFVGREKDKIFSVETIVKLTPKSIECNKHSTVEIKFNDGAVRKYEVSHITKCQEPIIDCNNHDPTTRTITCGIKIEFPFDKIALVSSKPAAIPLTSQEIQKDDLMKTQIVPNTITYTVNDLSSNDHTFNIEFTVKHDENKEAYQVTKTFTYLLAPAELPHLICTQKESQVSDPFAQITYSCDLLSKDTPTSWETQPSDYVLITPITSKQKNKNVYIDSELELKIKPNHIHCSKSQVVTVIFQSSGTPVKGTVIHKTTCPEPKILQTSFLEESRTITLEISASYPFTALTVESDTTNVGVRTEPSPITLSSETLKTDVTIKYNPTDWSSDTQKFHIIVKVTLNTKSIQSAKSNSYTVNLLNTEKQHIKCDKKDKISTRFTTSFFSCSIISRIPVITLQTDKVEYVIVDRIGKHVEENNVYKWTNLEVQIRDNQIDCIVAQNILLSFNENELKFSTQINIKTTCPTPTLDCHEHDKDRREISCKITAEYPYTAFTFTQVSGDITVSQPTEVSSITSDGSFWTSSHIVAYELTTLKGQTSNFKIKCEIKQASSIVHTKHIEDSYLIAPKEISQISCEEKLRQADQKITISKYSCYILAENDAPAIEFSTTNYDLKSNFGVKQSLIDLHKYENAEVAIEDKIMQCNKTVNLTLKLKDGKDKEYSNIVQHTTYCHQIYGKCHIVEKDVAYVICNFSSIQAFKFHKFSCSEVVSCEKVADMDRKDEKTQEHVIEFTPNTQSGAVEFSLNVTLNYSDYSQVNFVYDLELESRHVEKVESSKIVTGTSSTAMICGAGIVVVVAIILLSKRQKVPPKPEV